MSTRRCASNWRIAILAAAGLMSILVLQPAWAQEEAPKAADAAVDGGWPRGYATASGAKIIVYQPQVASWEDQKRMVAYAAVSYQPQGAGEPTWGTIQIQADTKVAVEDRLVNLAQLQIAEASFPNLQKEQTREIVGEITAAIPKEDRVIALDRVLAAVDKSQVIPKNANGIKADPPTVYVSTTPAILVQFDGPPIWSPIKDNNLKFAVNTNWDVFQDDTTSLCYLRNDKTWLKAESLEGPWSPAGKLPDGFTRLPDADWKDVREALPGAAIPQNKVPVVHVSENPAELILLQGKPVYRTVQGTGLMWVSNTESDLFRMGAAGDFYFLVAGRWFSAPDLNGPWTFATPNLPEDFKKIPPEHTRSRVLASVPGTEQAAEAVILAQVPQTARVNIKEVKAPEVAYQEAPQFEPIEGTSIQRAVNTDKDIIRVGDIYYMCYQGIWFMSTNPNGPWTVATKVAEEIYTIPASSPAYNVTYVTIDDDDLDDDWCEFVCAAGYTGMMVAWGCAVWGSGWYYPPYVWHGGFYPGYYPRPVTYGCGAWYNPWSGRYGWGAGAYGPYGGFGAGAVYNPRTGTYARGAVAYGPYGARGAATAWNPRTGGYATTRQGSNVYGSWGSTYVQRGDDWASTKRYSSRVTGDTTRVTRTDEGAVISHRGGPGDSGFVAKGEGGNVYAGHDGNVYRKQDGQWQSWDHGWNDVNRAKPAQTAPTRTTRDNATARTLDSNRATTRDSAAARTLDPNAAARTSAGTTRPPAPSAGISARPADTPTVSQLNRDYAARAEGAQRTRDYSSVRTTTGYSGGASSYRPSTSAGRGHSGSSISRGGFSGGGRGGFGGGRGGRRR